MPDGFDPSKFGGGSQNSSDDTGENGNPASDGSGNSGNRPSMGNFPGGFSGSTSKSTSMQNLALYRISVLILAAAILFSVLYRRKPRRR